MNDYGSWFESAVRDHTPLSAAGATRRETMRVDLMAAVVRRRRIRRTARAAVAVVVVAIGIFVVAGRGERLPAPDSPRAPILANADWTIVRDDPVRAARSIVRNASFAHLYADDDQFGNLLREAGSGIGFVRTGGRIFVTGAETPAED